MVRQVLISDLVPNMKDWRCDVLVIEKCHETLTATEKRVQKVVLVDREGSKILGTLWNDSIDLLHTSLIPYQRYRIGSVTVKKINADYLKYSPGMTLELTISAGAYIDLIVNELPVILHPPFKSMSYSEMTSTIGSYGKSDILAVVKEVRPVTQTRARGEMTDIQECVLINQELRPVVLTLWGKFISVQGVQLTALRDNCPIIMANKLTAKSFSGLSLGTTASTFLAIDPPIPEAQELRIWADKHMELLTETTPIQDPGLYHHAIEYSEDDIVTEIARLQPNGKNEWIHVELFIGPEDQKLIYTACPRCRRSTGAIAGETFRCHNCQTQMKAELKCRLDVYLKDLTATIKATFFDKIVEELVCHSATEINEMSHEVVRNLLRAMDSEYKGIKVHAYIRIVKSTYYQGKPRHAVQQIHPRPTKNNRPENVIADKASKEAQPISSKAIAEGTICQIDQTTNDEGPSNKKCSIKTEDGNFKADISASTATDDSPTKKVKMS